MLNILKSIAKATHRTEPFHSQFLADALVTSIQGERALFDTMWRLAAPDSWDPPECPYVHTEHHTGDGRRIDICIVDATRPRNRVLGIEVKVESASVLPNQLEAYHQGLTSVYPEADVAIAYLTPFNRQRAGTSADKFPPIKVFEEFSQTVEHARHLSWLDVADIEWDGRDIWRQHQSYVRSCIAPQTKLKDDGLQYLSFVSFFGADAAGRFWAALEEIGIYQDENENGAEIVLEKLGTEEVNSLVQAFEILIRDGKHVSTSEKQDDFAPNKRRSFITSRHREVHEALFELSRRFSNVWVEGTRDYAVRVAHKQYRSKGVSLVRSKGTATLETGRRRRARGPSHPS